MADSTEVVRPVQPPVISPENSPLVDLDYRILDPNVEFNLFDVYNWCYGKSVEKVTKIFQFGNPICLDILSLSLILFLTLSDHAKPIICQNKDVL